MTSSFSSLPPLPPLQKKDTLLPSCASLFLSPSAWTRLLAFSLFFLIPPIAPWRCLLPSPSHPPFPSRRCLATLPPLCSRRCFFASPHRPPLAIRFCACFFSQCVFSRVFSDRRVFIGLARSRQGLTPSADRRRAPSLSLSTFHLTPQHAFFFLVSPRRSKEKRSMQRRFPHLELFRVLHAACHACCALAPPAAYHRSHRIRGALRPARSNRL